MTAGVSFAIGQFIVSNYVGPELTASLAALFSLASVALLLRVWRPREETSKAAHRSRWHPIRRPGSPAPTAPTGS